MNTNVVIEPLTQQRSTLLPLVIKGLAAAPSMDDLCRRIVISCTEDLGFDRCGCFLYDAANNQKLGMWGIDDNGQLADERGMTAPIRDHERIPHHQANAPLVFTDHSLFHQDQYLGQGTLIECAIFDGDALLGWLFVDNFLTGRAFSQADIEFIHVFSTVVGQLMVRANQQAALTEQNRQLNETIRQLEAAQHEITEVKKMQSLGRLVSGIAHELNTPIGTSLTAVSHIQQLANTLRQTYVSGALSKSMLESSLDAILETASVGLQSVDRAGQLIRDFKQLVACKHTVPQTATDVKAVIERVFKDVARQFDHNVKLEMRADMSAQCWWLAEESFTHVIREIFRNAMLHAFAEQPTGTLCVEIKTSERSEPGSLDLVIADDGVGMGDALAQLFDPFYTKNPQRGSGLGASMVYNTVTHGLNGKIEVANGDPSGLIYHLTIPSSPVTMTVG